MPLDSTFIALALTCRNEGSTADTGCLRDWTWSRPHSAIATENTAPRSNVPSSTFT